MTTYLMVAAFVVGLLAILHALHKRSKSTESRIDLDDLLIGDDGRVSKAAAVMFGAFSATTWVLVYLTLNGKMSDLIFGAYMTAWVAPTVTKLIVDGGVKKAQAAGETSTNIEQQVVVQKDS